MLSSKFISSSVYNALPDIDGTAIISDATLHALGHLFKAFNVEQLVGIGLLHRHFKIARDTIMVHKGNVCKPEPIHRSLSATGTSFFWDGISFQAFEYGQGEPLALPNDFLGAFAHHLESHHLSGKVALSKLDMSQAMLTEHCKPETASGPDRTLWMESLDPATNSHIVEEAPQILPREATQWTFEGGAPVITHGCARTNGGQGDYYHKKKSTGILSCRPWKKLVSPQLMSTGSESVD